MIQSPSSLRLVLALLIATVVVVVSATPGVPSPALMAQSFALCQSDTECSLNFPSGGDLLVFEQMMLSYLSRRADGGIDLVAKLEVCGAVSGTDCGDMWLYQMRDARLCALNEQWVEGGSGCECISGRNCRDDCIAERSSEIWALFALIILVAIFEAASSAIYVHKQHLTTQNQKQISEDCRRMSAAIEVHVFAKQRAGIVPGSGSAQMAI